MCGLTPQYEQLENIQKAWANQGVCRVGFFPAAKKPVYGAGAGSEGEIKTYCATQGASRLMFKMKLH